MTIHFLTGQQLPSGWSQVPLLAVAHEARSKNMGLVERNLLSLSYGNIIRKDIEGSDGLLPASFEGYNRVQEGDLVLRLTDLQNDQRSLRTGYVGESGIITSAYVTLRPINIDAGYFSYVMHAYDVSKAFYTMGGGLRQGMGFADLKRMAIPLPPLDVQRRIADFLDDQVERLDAAVALRRESLRLADLRRTGHLDGLIEELGERNGWGRFRRWIRRIEQGWSPQCSSSAALPGEPGVIKLSAVRAGQFLAHENKAFLEGVLPDPRYSLKHHDLLVTRANTPVLVGDTAVVPSDFPDLYLSDLVYRVDIRDLNPYFASASLRSRRVRSVMAATGRGASQTMAKIRGDDIKDVVIPLASVQQQRAAVASINESEDGYCEFARLVQTQLALLEERKHSLITAAVTGQFDVSAASSRAAGVALSGAGGVS